MEVGCGCKISKLAPSEVLPSARPHLPEVPYPPPNSTKNQGTNAGRQPRAMAIGCSVWGVSRIPLSSSSRGGIPHLTLRFLFGNLWLLGGAVSLWRVISIKYRHMYNHFYITFSDILSVNQLSSYSFCPTLPLFEPPSPLVPFGPHTICVLLFPPLSSLPPKWSLSRFPKSIVTPH